MKRRERSRTYLRTKTCDDEGIGGERRGPRERD
jgi:hypothetical protein